MNNCITIKCTYMYLHMHDNYIIIIFSLQTFLPLVHVCISSSKCNCWNFLNNPADDNSTCSWSTPVYKIRQSVANERI